MPEQQLYARDAAEEFQTLPVCDLIFNPTVCQRSNCELDSFTNAYNCISNGFNSLNLNGYAYPDIARWTNIVDKAVEINGIYKGFLFIFQVCNNGMLLDMSALPLGVQLKRDIPENDILEKVNTQNLNNINGIRALYDKQSHFVFLKRNMGLNLELKSEYFLYYMNVCFGYAFGGAANMYNNMAELFEPTKN